MGRQPRESRTKEVAPLTGAGGQTTDARVIRAAKAPKYNRPRQQWGANEYIQAAITHLCPDLSKPVNMVHLTREVNVWLSRQPESWRIGEVSRKTVRNALTRHREANK
jgi:hypothetical protein